MNKAVKIAANTLAFVFCVAMAILLAMQLYECKSFITFMFSFLFMFGFAGCGIMIIVINLCSPVKEEKLPQPTIKLE